MKRVGITALVALLCGCVTYESGYRPEPATRDEIIALQEDQRRLSSRVEGLELEISRISSELAALRARTTQAADAGSRALEARIAELDARLRALDAAREKDKQELLDSLSRKIAQIMSAPATSTKKPAAGERKTTGPMTGYEHVVQPGETLSAIAAAYGVSVKVIMEDNDIKDPNRLRVGQKLFIRD